jgi:DNA-binding NarL/FixJ family response regulator
MNALKSTQSVPILNAAATQATLADRQGIMVRVYAEHPVAAAQYGRLLGRESGLRVVERGEQAEVGIFDGDPSMVATALRTAVARTPGLRPLVLAASDDDGECQRWLRSGAWGLVTYGRYEEDLPRAVRHLAEGHIWFPSGVVMRWMRDHAAALHAAPPAFALTPREQEIVDLLAAGEPSNKEIAAALRISERTVKFHIGNILSKLNVASRRELARVLPIARA